MMSCFLISLPLFFWTPQFALLLLSVIPLFVLFFWSVFSLYLCLFVSVGYLSRAAEHSGIPVKSFLFFFFFFLDCFTVTVYVDSLFLFFFFLDSVFAGFQNWTSSLLTHFSWQTLSLKVYL